MRTTEVTGRASRELLDRLDRGSLFLVDRHRGELWAQVSDTVLGLYAERCQHFLRSPPPGDWDGVWELKDK